jgi:hypothetical protein
MVVVMTAEAGTVPVLVVSASELGSRSGSLLREVAAGALVRVDDLRVKRTCALLVPPQLANAVLEFLGVSPDGLPEPGEAADRLPPDEVPA